MVLTTCSKLEKELSINIQSKRDDTIVQTKRCTILLALRKYQAKETVWINSAYLPILTTKSANSDKTEALCLINKINKRNIIRLCKYMKKRFINKKINQLDQT